MLKSPPFPSFILLLSAPELSFKVTTLLLQSKLPPSCGVVSSTILLSPLAGNDSNVGSAPLFALKNLPLLDDVPCGSLSSVTAWSAILAETTALGAIRGDVIAWSCICSLPIASSAIFPLCIASQDISEDETD